MKCPSCASYLDAGAARCWRCKQPLSAAGGEPALAGAGGAAVGVAAPPPASWEVDAPPVRKSRSGIVVGVVGLLLIALVIGGAAVWRFDLLDFRGQRAVDDYIAGGGVEYVSEGGGYAVDFPTSPREYTESTPAGIDFHYAVSEPGSDYEFAVVFSDPLPSSPTGAAANRQLESAAFLAAEIYEGEVVGLNDEPFVQDGQTFPALDARIETDDEQARLRLILIDDRIYEVGAYSESQVPDAYHRLVDSFRPEL